jgi:transcriptional regulator with XRE-family HTH domain
MGLGKRVEELIENKGVTAYEVSVKTGISQASLSRIINNNTAKLKISSIDILADYFNVSRDWLKSGVGNKLETNNGDSKSDVQIAFLKERIRELNAELEQKLEKIAELKHELKMNERK